MIFIFLAMIFYTAVIIFGAVAGRHANSIVSAAVTNLVSAIVPLVVVVPLVGKKAISSQRFGVFFAALCGLAVAAFAITINKAYAHNKVGIVAPMVFGGAMFLSTTLSYFIFKEKVSAVQSFGLLLLALGLGVVTFARATGR